MIRGYLFTGVYYVLSLICVMLALPAMLLPGQAAVRGLVRLYTLSTRFALRWIAGISTNVRGKHLLPEGPFILAAKHQSWGDGFLIYPEVNNLVFVTGDHLEKFPLVGRILTKLGAIVIDTCGGSHRRAESLAEGVQQAKEEGRRVLIYPEGHLAPFGFHFPYKPGVWHMQQAMGVPVVPVATNLGLFWQQQEILKKPGKAVIEFLDPIQPGLSKSEFLALLESRVEGRCSDLARKAGREGKSELLPEPVRAG
ncbi:1-acyl-sn-glycerol-3-phosphate acyltransferase [Henriciella sp.]|uniref:lysophospholipid acyltransferase family protein n=1 Tax=Henriciella sp. TaxID=1968823 RepID=UPI0025B97EBD|nr:1-acyl-sn-glycerol-3-phosphate acyltransferase [Henriciella sp.]